MRLASLQITRFSSLAFVPDQVIILPHRMYITTGCQGETHGACEVDVHPSSTDLPMMYIRAVQGNTGCVPLYLSTFAHSMDCAVAVMACMSNVFISRQSAI